MRHKWYNEIVAWASGAEIESKVKNTGMWVTVDDPYWHVKDYEYRIKPSVKEPQYLYVYRKENGALYGIEKKETTTSSFIYIGKIKLEEE